MEENMLEESKTEAQDRTEVNKNDVSEAEVSANSEEIIKEQQADVVNESEETKDEERKSKFYNNQTVLTIRVLVGGYVIYLAYQIFTDPNKNTWTTIFAGLFVIIGAFLVIASLMHLIKGEYQGGKADVSDSEENEVKAKDLAVAENIADVVTTEEVSGDDGSEKSNDNED